MLLDDTCGKDISDSRMPYKALIENIPGELALTVRLICKDGTPRAVDIRGAVIERTSERVTIYILYTELMSALER